MAEARPHNRGESAAQPGTETLVSAAQGTISRPGRGIARGGSSFRMVEAKAVVFSAGRQRMREVSKASSFGVNT